MLKDGTMLYLRALHFIQTVNKLELYGADMNTIKNMIHEQELGWSRLLDQVGIRKDILFRGRW